MWRFRFWNIMEVMRTSHTPYKAMEGLGAQEKTRKGISNSGCKMNTAGSHLSGYLIFGSCDITGQHTLPQFPCPMIKLSALSHKCVLHTKIGRKRFSYEIPIPRGQPGLNMLKMHYIHIGNYQWMIFFKKNHFCYIINTEKSEFWLPPLFFLHEFTELHDLLKISWQAEDGGSADNLSIDGDDEDEAGGMRPLCKQYEGVACTRTRAHTHHTTYTHSHTHTSHTHTKTRNSQGWSTSIFSDSKPLLQRRNTLAHHIKLY